MQAFELTPLMLEIIDLVESGQIGDELDARVAMLVSEGPAAINNWIYGIKELEGQVNTLKDRIDNLTERKRKKQESIERMRDILQSVLVTCFNGKVKTDEYSAGVSDRKKLEIRLKEGRSFKELPTMFFKTEYKLELKAIKDAAKDGITHEALDYIETNEPTLTIR